ncbi:MAG: hypothetical protein QW472_05145 [Candidatus Aenigmatarchaeota archaeon]
MRSYEIRQLIENYYDIQKIRVETFNRLVCWVRENKEKIKEYLKSQFRIETHIRNASQKGFETQIGDASHGIIETHKSSASQPENETHGRGASQRKLETHQPYASHCRVETQENDASHFSCETHRSDASHERIETHNVYASHILVETQGEGASHFNFETHLSSASHFFDETHPSYALKLLEEAENQKGVKGMKKYSEFVKKFVLSQVESETHQGDASHYEIETHCRDASQKELETQFVDASHGGFETQVKNAIFSEIENLIWFHNKLYETEKELQKRLDVWSKNHKLRKEFLNYVRGIGGVLASGIIAWLDEVILKAEHPSSLWKYCGLYPGSERKRGEKLPYNLRLKSFCWKIGQSFIKFKCFGRKLYDRFKEEAKQKHPDWNKMHIHNHARRKVVKVFLACLWKKWREMNNLPTPEPYAIAHLKHSDLITPEMWMEKKTAGEKNI